MDELEMSWWRLIGRIINRCLIKNNNNVLFHVLFLPPIWDTTVLLFIIHPVQRFLCPLAFAFFNTVSLHKDVLVLNFQLRRFKYTQQVKSLDTYFWLNVFSLILMVIQIIDCHSRHQSYERTQTERIKQKKKQWNNSGKLDILDDLE